MRPQDSPVLIVADKLSRTYSLGASEVVGVQDVDLCIRAGELVVLKGESGSGKSTLLALLAGFDRPTRGRLEVAGRDLVKATPTQLNRYRREVVGMVFQSFNLMPSLSVLENVCLPALLAGGGLREVRARAEAGLRELGLKDRASHYPSQLSGGEMQRTAMARALINEPALILADEPTGNLDSRNGQTVIELLAELNRGHGRTVIIATHSQIADPYATMHLSLKDGRVLEAATL
jgi:ABC-type lipoprotein export system ATPase subunit